MSLSSWLDERIEAMRHLEECEFEFPSFSEKRTSLTRLVHETLNQWESRRREVVEKILAKKEITPTSSSRSDSDEDVEESSEERARYLADRGRILAFGDKQDVSEAHELLTKAVRLNPSIGDAWLSLGRVFIQKNEVENARECFQKAVDKERSVVPLRELSRCLRMIGKEKLIESLSIAKEAVSKNVTDPESWYLLGNVLLSCGFQNLYEREGDPSSVIHVDSCLRAYSQAQRLGMNHPDLWGNRGSVEKYILRWNAAWQSFNRAIALDGQLVSAIVGKREIESVLRKAHEVFEKKEGIREKTLKKLVGKLEELSRDDAKRDEFFYAAVLALISPITSSPLQFVAMTSTRKMFVLGVYEIHSDAIPNLSIVHCRRRHPSLASFEDALMQVGVDEIQLHIDCYPIQRPADNLYINGKRIRDQYLLPASLSIQVVE
eukprot:TRINITY_DN2180_c0_g1_i1.p1 TRINITY_DN2180_c0_g1~~TRINITY_DN2180_c0_g1_i1.p1  ORF type:complete len:434 (-),score=118.25 TRINITY_DN2180_c0_g1_i1:70-1371(-)